MKTFELFEDVERALHADGFIHFTLNRDEVGFEAGHIAQEVARRIGGEVAKVQQGSTVRYGEHTFEPINVVIRLPDFWANADTWIEKATKALRRLSRGKPRFHAPEVSPWGVIGGQYENI